MIVYREFLEDGGFIEHLNSDAINPSNQYIIIEKPDPISYDPNIDQTNSETSLWRIRTILRLRGMEETIENAINLLDEPKRTSAKYIWEYGSIIDRSSQTLKMIQYALGISDSEVDEIFSEANNLNM